MRINRSDRPCLFLTALIVVTVCLGGAYCKFWQIVGDPHTDQVAELNIWTYNSWTNRILGNGDTGKIYHPYQSTILYSEPQLAQGTVAILLKILNVPIERWLNYINSAVHIVNFVAVFGLAMLCFQFVRTWQGKRDYRSRIIAATVIAHLTTMSPCLIREAGVLQLQWIWPAVVLVGALWRWKSNIVRIATIGVCIATLGFGCLYHWAFVIIVYGGGCVAAYLGGIANLKSLTASLGGIFLGCLLLLPMLYQMKIMHEEMGFGRTLEDSSRGALRINEILKPSSVQRVFHNEETWLTFDSSRSLGYGYMFISALGVVLVLKRRMFRFISVSVVPSVIALLLSLGPSESMLTGRHTWTFWPYDLIYHFTPILKGMRSPYRAEIIMLIALIPCACVGWAEFHRQISKFNFRGFGNHNMVYGMLITLAFIEVIPSDSRTVSLKADHRVVWEAARAEGCRVLTFVDVSEGPPRLSVDTIDSNLMLGQAFYDGPAMTNGYSGYEPFAWAQWKRLAHEDPKSALDGIQDFKTDGIVLIHGMSIENTLRDSSLGLMKALEVNEISLEAKNGNSAERWSEVLDTQGWQVAFHSEDATLYTPGGKGEQTAISELPLECHLYGGADMLYFTVRIAATESIPRIINEEVTIQTFWNDVDNAKVVMTSPSEVSLRVNGLMHAETHLKWSIPVPTDGAYFVKVVMAGKKLNESVELDRVIIKGGWVWIM